MPNETIILVCQLKRYPIYGLVVSHASFGTMHEIQLDHKSDREDDQP